MARDLRAELKATPTWWKPVKDDMIVGTLIRFEETTSAQYGTNRVAVIKSEDGQWYKVTLSTTVLRKKFEEQDPQPGDGIGIRYLGEHPVKKYKMWEVVVAAGEGDAVSPEDLVSDDEEDEIF